MIKNNTLALYAKAYPSILYAKKNGLLKERVPYTNIPEEIRIKLIASKLEECEDADEVRPDMGYCCSRRLLPEHPCDRWTCGICALHAMDQYFKGGVSYD